MSRESNKRSLNFPFTTTCVYTFPEFLISYRTRIVGFFEPSTYNFSLNEVSGRFGNTFAIHHYTVSGTTRGKEASSDRLLTFPFLLSISSESQIFAALILSTSSLPKGTQETLSDHNRLSISNTRIRCVRPCDRLLNVCKLVETSMSEQCSGQMQ